MGTSTVCVSANTAWRAPRPRLSPREREAEACAQSRGAPEGFSTGLRPNVAPVLLLTKDPSLCHGWRQPRANMSIRRNNLHPAKRHLFTLFSSRSSCAFEAFCASKWSGAWPPGMRHSIEEHRSLLPSLITGPKPLLQSTSSCGTANRSILEFVTTWFPGNRWPGQLWVLTPSCRRTLRDWGESREGGSDGVLLPAG